MAWNAAGRQTQVISRQFSTTSMSYDGLNHRARRRYANNALTTQTYDLAGNLSGITNNGPSALVSRRSNTYHKANHRTV